METFVDLQMQISSIQACKSSVIAVLQKCDQDHRSVSRQLVLPAQRMASQNLKAEGMDENPTTLAQSLGGLLRNSTAWHPLLRAGRIVEAGIRMGSRLPPR